MLVLSTLYPQAAQRTTNVVAFCYSDDIPGFEREFVETHRAASLETVREGDEIAGRMDAGRRAPRADAARPGAPASRPQAIFFP